MVSTASNKQQIPQRELNLYPIDYPFETLIANIDKTPPSLILQPDFQRQYKWDDEKASRFIESCLMQIPLPSCYFAENRDKNHEVIDGLQRINSVYRFTKNEFALTGLTVYEELNGKFFNDLDSDIKRHIETYTIRCIVLRNDNDRLLINEIFARLNQGSVVLEPQEIRHALYPGNLDQLLIELAQLEPIQQLLKGEEPKNRKGEEIVLRFFALNNNLDDYDGNLTNYLNQYMLENQTLSESTYSEFSILFRETVEKCQIVFRDDIFRNLTNQRNSLKSIAIYDTQMYSLQHFSREFIEEHKVEIYSKFEEVCNDPEFQKTYSWGLAKRNSILQRRNIWKAKLESIR
jgi:hypothetical protein